MTEPSQYFKGRTVQEQMNEVISYVDVRAEEVAAAKADDVLEPAEQAKDAAQAAQAAAEDAQDAAEAARDTTLAALPQIQQDISDLKAEDVALDGRLDNVELRITTAEGNIVTIQGRVTAVETKNNQQDIAIAALQTADAQNVKINNVNDYAVGLTGNQPDITGVKGFHSLIKNVEIPVVNSSSTNGMWKEIARWENVTGNWHGLIEIFNPLQTRYALIYYNLATNFHQIAVIAKTNFTSSDIALNYNDSGSICRLMLKNSNGLTGVYVKYNTFVNTPTPLNIVDGDEYSEGNFPETNTVVADFRGWDQS